MERTCTTQAQLEAAVAAGEYPVLSGNGDFVLPQTCTGVAVEGSSQPRVEAWESSQPRVVAWESSQPRVEARGSSQPRVVARESSQPRVEARGSSQPRVEAWGSSQPRVEAWESSQPRVEAWESSQPRVEARGSSQLQIRADHPVTVTGLSARASVCRNKHVTIDGEVGFDVEVDEVTDPLAWLGHYGIEVAEDGTAVLFKRVGDDWRSSYGTSYAPGEVPVAKDWNARPVCGGGLHLSPHPRLTERYSSGARLLAVQVAAADLVPIPSWDAEVADKCKVRSCVVLHECDEDGDPLQKADAAA